MAAAESEGRCEEQVRNVRGSGASWLLKLNVDKCQVVSYGRQVEKNKYVMVQNNCIVELHRDEYTLKISE